MFSNYFFLVTNIIMLLMFPAVMIELHTSGYHSDIIHWFWLMFLVAIIEVLSVIVGQWKEIKEKRADSY